MFPNTGDKRKEIACFTFDDGFTGTSGEWVSNYRNVGFVSGDCVSGQCAHFSDVNSRLEVPRFSAAFDAWREFSLSFWLLNMVDGPREIVTNGDCHTGDPPSLYVYGHWAGQLKVGMSTRGGVVATATVRIVSIQLLCCIMQHIKCDQERKAPHGNMVGYSCNLKQC